MSYLLTSATVEELKAVLQKGGLEILAEGGSNELARFLASDRGRETYPVAVIWLSGSRRERAEMRDRSVLAAKGFPVPITSDAP